MENLDLSKLPKHIAIIMDGNGRWAQEQGQDRLFGHYQGVISVRKVVEAATEIGIQYLTLYAFSTENWERPEEEVTGLMTLFVDTIAKEVPDLHKNNIKLRFIGNLGLLPPHARAALDNASHQTAANTGLTLIVALSYSSRWELVEAAKNIATQVKEGSLNIDKITEITDENVTDIHTNFNNTRKLLESTQRVNKNLKEIDDYLFCLYYFSKILVFDTN